MAAHEEQISHNRRRLFKALSTAPVVATLSPGSALANQSAFQCLVNPTTPANFHLTDPGCSDTDVCYAYQERTYWDVSAGTASTSPPPAAWPAEISALLGEVIVEIATDTYLTLTGNVVDGAILEKSADGSTLSIRTITPPLTYVADIPTMTGLGLMVVEPLDANGDPTTVGSVTAPAVDIDITGVYPEVQPAGDLQGIAGTCLTSIIPGASGFSIAKG